MVLNCVVLWGVEAMIAYEIDEWCWRALQVLPKPFEYQILLYIRLLGLDPVLSLSLAYAHLSHALTACLIAF
jgi:hypothetical protein